MSVGQISGGWIRPSAFEIAIGAVMGAGLSQHVTAVAEPVTPRQALDAAIRPLLERQPCIVTFSGGRDSSAVLAVAVDIARRHGLPLPVPVTRRWPAYPETDESRWQELVVRHLGLADWERIDFDEMDLVGPTCAASLAVHGPLWPPLLHTWPRVFERARGGSILTGEGGDELFEVRRATPVRRMLAYPRQVRPPLLNDAVAWGMPRSIRRRVMRDELRQGLPPWLSPAPATRWVEEVEAWTLGEPYRWDRAVTRAVSDEGHGVGHHNLAVMAALHGTRIAHPLLDSAFGAALVRQGGRLGYPGRTSAMRLLFADLLPDELLARRDKVFTNTVVFAAATRAFARDWTGAGVDPDLVDVARLRHELAAPRPHPAAALALQAGWVADSGQSGDQKLSIGH